MRATVYNTVLENDADMETISADKTLDEEDVGKVFKVDTDGKTITLPATVVGYTYTIVNWMDDGTGAVTISPNASDKIMGIDVSSSDNKDLINTKSTAQKGDKVTLFGDGSLGWYVMNATGTWERES
jgi:hypothetical protein